MTIHPQIFNLRRLVNELKRAGCKVSPYSYGPQNNGINYSGPISGWVRLERQAIERVRQLLIRNTKYKTLLSISLHQKLVNRSVNTK